MDNPEDAVAFRDLPVYEAARTAATDVELVTAAVTELLERLTTGAYTTDAAYDIAADLLEATDRLHAFALTALG